MNKVFSRMSYLPLALSLVLVSGVTACQNIPTTQTGAAQSQNAQLNINNDRSSLNERLTPKDQVVNLEKEGDFTTQQQQTTPQLKWVAEVAPPLVNKTSVQATNVHIEGHLAYVSYDIAGDAFSGGAYIIDISDPHHPQLLSEVTLNDTDYYALKKSGQTLFLSGASLRENLKSRAMVQAITLSENGQQFVADAGLIDVPSFAATDITSQGQNLYVSTGAQDGGVAKINMQTLTQEAFYPLEDARSVSADYTETGAARVVAIKGTPGAVHVLDTDLNLLRKKELLNTATIPFSKSTVEIQGSRALLGLGDGGAQIFDLSTMNSLSTLKAPAGLTNGASVNGELAFTAEGEDGVSMSRLGEDGSLQRLGSFRFNDTASANMVAYQNNVLFVANGRGGLSILTVEDNAPAPISGGIQAVYLRWLQAEGNTGGSRVAGTFKINGPGRIVGVVSNPQNGSQNLSNTDFFAASIAAELPNLLQNTPGSQQRTLEKGDVFEVKDPQTLDFDFFLGHPGGSDDIRILIDHGTTVEDNQLTVTLKQPPSTEAGIVVGKDHQEVLERSVPLSTRAQGPIGESVYTVRPAGHDLIVHREAMVERNRVPAEYLNVDLPTPVASPEPTPVPTPTPEPSPQDPCQGNASNLVVNGGFELPQVPSNAYKFVKPLTCWTLVKPDYAELDSTGIWQPAEGQQSLDLNPDQPAEMFQNLYTTPGQAYRLSFQMAGNISSPQGVKTLEVFWGDQSLGLQTFDTRGKSKNNMGWKTVTINIPAEATQNARTALRFVSRTEKSSVGPVIDNVIVSPVSASL